MSRGLVQKLRARVKDERYKSGAFSLSVADGTVTKAILEVTRQRLYVTVEGTTGLVAPNLDLNLTDDRYETVGGLARYLQTVPGYTVQLSEDCEHDHPSSDLQPTPPTIFNGGSPELKTRMFADEQLLKILDEAARRHNPNYDASTIPEEEEVFVLLLAQAVLMRTLANDSIKRRKLEEEATDLLAVATAYEEAYGRDMDRHRRVIPSPVLTAQQKSVMREGDIVIGHLYRRSLRTGQAAPMASGLPLSPPVLLDPRPEDVEDDNVRLRWERNTDEDFGCLELWRDTQPNVQRSGYGQSYTPQFDYNVAYGYGVGRRTTSKCVFRVQGTNNLLDSRGFSSCLESYGQMVTSFLDRGIIDTNQDAYGLEPDTDYFWRLFMINTSDDAVASEVMRLRTKEQRSLIQAVSPPTLARGGGGQVTVQAIYLTPDTKVLVDGKELINPQVTTASDGSGTIVGALPTFRVPGARDVVLLSPNNLYDVAYQAVTLT